MRRVKTPFGLGLLVLALLGMAGTVPAAAGGGTVDREFYAVGTTSSSGPGDCVVIGEGLLECEAVRTGGLLGLPFWLATWSGANTSVTDFNSPCTDFLGRSAFSLTGSSDVVMTAGGSELFVHRDFSGCWLEGTAGYTIGTLTFTGGTGAFAGASGSATILIAHDPDPAAGDLTLAIGTLTI